MAGIQRRSKKSATTFFDLHKMVRVLLNIFADWQQIIGSHHFLATISSRLNIKRYNQD